jgi:hypothetical protein
MSFDMFANPVCTKGVSLSHSSLMLLAPRFQRAVKQSHCRSGTHKIANFENPVASFWF